MAEEKRKRILSGIQPTGTPTLGNYIGAVRNWALLQSDYDCLYMVADLHSLTVRQVPADLRRRTRELAALLLAVAASAVMIGVVVFLSRWQTAGRSYVAVLHYQGEKPGDEIVRALGRNKFAVKSKTLRAEGTELAVEVCCRDNASEVTDRLRSIEGVEDVTMI